MDGVMTELWQLVASGLVNSVLTALLAITPRDTRGVLERDGALLGWLRMQAAQTLQYAPSEETVRRALAYIEEIRYSPRFSLLYVRPTNAAVTGGNTLTADAPSNPFILYVYEWNFVTFNLLGPLGENNQPGAGVYVLVPESQTQKGLPSQYLTIS